MQKRAKDQSMAETKIKNYLENLISINSFKKMSSIFHL